MRLPTARLEEILDELAGFVRRFVWMTDAQATAVALWTAHSYVLGAAEASPILAVSSAEKRSGKTRLFDVLELLVARPWRVIMPSEAVVFRKIERDRPAILLDEIDAIFRGRTERTEPLRALLNAGNRRGTKIPRCVGANRDELHEFDIFCCKATAGIGDPPDTVADRSLPIRLQRRAPNEPVERFRRRDVEPEAEPLREQLEALIVHVDALATMEPDLPAELDDRAQDAAEPLLAISDLAGGDWPERARQALVELYGGRDVEDDSSGVRLLADIRSTFEERGVDRLASEGLRDALHRLDEAPWGDWYGKPLSARSMAKMLKPYGIQSRTVRFDDDTTAKGFLREQFEGAWSRYVPHLRAEIRHKATTRSGSGLEPDFQTSQESLVTHAKSSANPHWRRDVTDVTDTEPGGTA